MSTAKAELKYCHIQPTKLRRVVEHIRGENVQAALKTVRFMPYRAAGVIEKLLKSAVSNAVNNHQLNADRLVVKSVQVGQAMIMKRGRARSRGMAAPRQKKWSHVTIELLEK